LRVAYLESRTYATGAAFTIQCNVIGELSMHGNAGTAVQCGEMRINSAAESGQPINPFSGALGSVIHFLSTKSRRVVAITALLTIFLSGYLDWVAGQEVTACLFYAVPLMLVALRGDVKLAYVFAAVCGFVWWQANMEDNRFSSLLGFSWAVCTRAIFFFLTVAASLAVHRHYVSMLKQFETYKRSQCLERDLAIAGEQIVTTAEREQQRIGRDLHDGLSQHLAGIRYAASALAERLEGRSAPEAQAGHEIENLVEKATEQVRDLIRGINPVRLDETGLAAALQELAMNVSRRLGIEVEYRTAGKPRLSSSESSLHLFRIAQEALNNAVKHGDSAKIVLSLASSDHKLSITVSDDGPGFGPLAIDQTGIGLSIMQYRARLIGAKLQILSSPTGGTTVTCELPV